jgi:hypothetical protein
MRVVIENHVGRVHHGEQHPSLAEIRPIYAFVPEEFFGGTGFQKSRYLDSRWPSINCSANLYSVGSHVIPNPLKPVSIRSRCPVLREFLSRLATIAAVKGIEMN